MTRATFLTVSILVLPVARASAQPVVDYGNVTELKGLKKVFVCAGTETARRNIIQRLQKDLPGLIVTEEAQDAEVHLLLTADVSTYSNGIKNKEIYDRTVVHCKGLVATYRPDGRPRILMTFNASAGSISQRRPGTKFAQAFVEAYKGANGLR